MKYTRLDKLRDQIETFAKSGFKRSKFTVAIYEAMSQNSSFIAHFDRDGFYKARFADREGLKETLRTLRGMKPSTASNEGIKKLLRWIPSLYDESIKTFKLGEPIFRNVNGRIGVFYDANTKFDTVLNLTGYPDAYLGKGAGIYKAFVEITHTPIVTNSDSIAMDWIINLDDQGQRVSKDRLVIFVYTGRNDQDTHVDDKFHCGASIQRLKAAQIKLKTLGYKTKFCKDLVSCKKLVESLRIQGKQV